MENKNIPISIKSDAEYAGWLKYPKDFKSSLPTIEEIETELKD